MSSVSVAWPISADWVASLLQARFELESPVSVWAAGFDDTLRQIVVVFDAEESDLSKLVTDGEPLLQVGDDVSVN